MLPFRFCYLTPLAFLLCGCPSLTEPPAGRDQQATSTPPSPAPAPEPEAQKPPSAARPAASPEDRVAASHILVAHKDGMRARPTITRTKEEAKKYAEELLARLKKGADFNELAKEESDDPSAARNGGNLGEFPRRAMVAPFSDAAFALKPGQLSGIVETPFGFHIIKREK